MFDHVTVRASDRDASERFYDTVLSTLGIERTNTGEWDDFSIAAAGDGNPVTRRVHMGFVAPSRAEVDEFWRVGTAAGYADDGAPGPRPQYTEDYYGAFLLDPDGNSAEAVHHGSLRRDGGIDHLWVRVADVAAAKRFYATIAPHAGLRLAADTPERVSFHARGGRISLVAGTPSENVHIAFPAADATVDALHLLDPDGNNVEVVNHKR